MIKVVAPLMPFTLSLSKGSSWFDKAFSPERSRRVAMNGSEVCK
jgi:hypothetical protein